MRGRRYALLPPLRARGLLDPRSHLDNMSRSRAGRDLHYRYDNIESDALIHKIDSMAKTFKQTENIDLLKSYLKEKRK